MKISLFSPKTRPLGTVPGVIILNALIIILLLMTGRASGTGLPAIHWALMIAAIVLSGTCLILQRWTHGRLILTVLFILDVPLITVIIHFAGGIESVLSFLYVPLIITSSVFLTRKPVYIIGLLSVACYIALTLFEKHAGGYSLSYITNRFSLLGLLYLFTSIIGSSLSERYRIRTEEVRRLRITTEEIIKNLPSGITTIDQRGDILYTNIPAGPIQSRVHLHLAKFLRYADTAATIELRIKGRYYLLSCARVYHDQAALGILQDLTDIRRLEDRSRISNQTKMLAELGGSLAHELRNPLSSIHGALEVIARANQDKKVASFIDLAVKESIRLNQIVTDFLHFAQFTPGKLNRIPISDVITEALLESTQQYKHRAVELVRQGDDFFILADLERLKSGIINIMNNAVESSQDGQHVIIRTKRFRRVGTVDIIDEGPGIPPKDLARIFTPFFTTKKGGTGLGLSIAQKVIEAHQGRINAKSKIGKGTMFRVFLPLA